MDETLTTLLTLPHEIEFDDTVLYIYCTVEEDPIINFEYTGAVQEDVLSVGTYKLEC